MITIGISKETHKDLKEIQDSYKEKHGADKSFDSILKDLLDFGKIQAKA